ncbi:DUF2244 domain-containing protein [Bordetella sp. BOR01]|uniref:DUF2244 domain-containing protein n=1 Tax=Bordetella sp. BOR01 TaxID=2854779 RepID=UPI001C468314|nr:DUF2244 domain-containing protein [Bordetella sp. BOR01]MBV7486137.1 DUF2244 domain-containing protein [Bordetella sp. BOR01]
MRPAHAITGAPPPLTPPTQAAPAGVAPPAGAGTGTGTDIEQCWVLKRNCCVTPGQFLLGMGGTAAIALLVSLYFTLRGLWPVAVYGAAEILLIAGATLSFARHVRDGETVILLADGRMIVEVHSGAATTRHVFNRNWARLVRRPDTPDTLWLHYGSVRLRLARHVPSERRRHIETELRHSLPWRGPAPR